MKISKTKKCASATSTSRTDSVTEVNKYQAGIDYIKAAIDSLAENAKEDDTAKDAIANLSVVLLSLK